MPFCRDQQHFSQLALTFPVTLNVEHLLPPLSTYITLEAGEALWLETISALIYQHPCRSVLDKEAATGGAAPGCPCVCSPLCCNANMQLSEEKSIKKKPFQNSTARVSALNSSFTTPEVFSWLVSPVTSPLRSLRSIKTEIFRKDL